MRSIKTFILRLYVDQDVPELLCGDLNALPANKAIAFKNQADLLSLLQLSICQTPEKPKCAEELSRQVNSAKREIKGG
jgi:hypothetical protein